MTPEERWQAARVKQKHSHVRSLRRKAYRQVDERDGGFCRCCGIRTRWIAQNVVAPDRREHHHLEGRGEPRLEVSSNIVTLCKTCHDLRHVTRTLSIFGSADACLRFRLVRYITDGATGRSMREIESWEERAVGHPGPRHTSREVAYADRDSAGRVLGPLTGGAWSRGDSSRDEGAAMAGGSASGCGEGASEDGGPCDEPLIPL